MMATSTEKDLLAPGGMMELVGRTEAAQILGVQRPNLTTMKGLPEPVVEYLHAGKLWLRRDIEKFARDRATVAASR
jgi:hypothetical protein